MNSMIKIGSAGGGGKGDWEVILSYLLLLSVFFSIIIVVHKHICVVFYLWINSYKIGLINRVDRLTF